MERLKMCADCRVIDIYSATDEVQIDAVADGRNIQGLAAMSEVQLSNDGA